MNITRTPIRDWHPRVDEHIKDCLITKIIQYIIDSITAAKIVINTNCLQNSRQKIGVMNKGCNSFESSSYSGIFKHLKPANKDTLKSRFKSRRLALKDISMTIEEVIGSWEHYDNIIQTAKIRDAWLNKVGNKLDTPNYEIEVEASNHCVIVYIKLTEQALQEIDAEMEEYISDYPEPELVFPGKQVNIKRAD